MDTFLRRVRTTIEDAVYEGTVLRFPDLTDTARVALVQRLVADLTADDAAAIYEEAVTSR